MAPIDEIAVAARNRDALRVRSLIRDWLRANRPIARVPAPRTTDPTLLAISAGLVELLAERLGEPAPSWAAQIPAAPEAVYLVDSARTLPRLRRLCETESPHPLRRRNLFAPPTFLEWA